MNVLYIKVLCFVKKYKTIFTKHNPIIGFKYLLHRNTKQQ